MTNKWWSSTLSLWLQTPCSYQKVLLSQNLLYNLLCLYLISHNCPISTVHLGWSYGYAHHSLVLLPLLICSIIHSFIHLFIQQIFTEPLPQVLMSSRWYNQECSLLSPLLQILQISGFVPDPFFYTSHFSQCSWHGIPLHECWGQSRAWHSLALNFTEALWALMLSHCPIRSVMSGGPSQRTCSFHIHHSVECTLGIQETFSHPTGEWTNGVQWKYNDFLKN